MAVSQTLTLTEVSTNPTANTSKVRILWKSTQSGDSYNNYTRTAEYMIRKNGSSNWDIRSISYTLPKNQTVTLVDEIIEVEHLGDGTGSVQVNTIMNTGISAGTVSKEAYLVLTTFPRSSNISSVSDTELGDSCSVKWTPASSGFTYKLNFSIGSWSHTTGVIKPNTTAAYTYGYTLPLSVAKQLPNATSGTMKVILATYTDDNGTVQIGSNSTAYCTITVPNDESTQPTVGMSLSPSHNLKSTYDELYLQGFSKVKADIDSTAKYDATIVASYITVSGKDYTDPYESDILTQTGLITVKATVKDSRGYYGTNYEEIEVLPYDKPRLLAYSGESSIIAARCDKSANFTDSGTYLKIKAKAEVSKVISNGVQHNYGNIKFRYRKEGGTYSGWQTILNCKTDNSDEIITAPLLNGALDIKSNYQVQIVAFDDFSESVPITIAVPSDAVYMDRPVGGKSMGLGGYSSGDGNLDIHWKTKARGGLSLFDSKGDEIPLDSTLPIPRGQVAEGWNPNNLANGTYVVTDSKPLKSGETVIMYNGILIQINGTVDGSVKFQLALTSDETRSPYYRAYWYGNWGNWRSMKL